MNEKQNKTRKPAARPVKNQVRPADARQQAGKEAAPERPKQQRQGAAQRPVRRPGQGVGKRRGEQPPSTPMKIYPLGGLGEIGKNLTVYECAGDMIVVDCGSLFPDSDMYGVDLVIPDFAFLEQNRAAIKAVVITHGHEDHIGALPYFLREINAPVFGTKLTLGLIGNKLEEHGLRSSTELRMITPREKFKLGCFTIDPIHVNHSIPGAVAFAIECPAGVVIQTGDFKVDYTPIGGGTTDLAAFADYGEKGVLALLSDSTNSERAGMSTSENKVNEGMAALFNRADKQRVIVATFASNLYRVQLLIDLAVQQGRKVAISGRSMVNNTRMAAELGFLRAPDGVLIDIDQVGKYPPEKIAIITTGSQGETLSALSRMAMNSHRQVHVGQGDFIIISATPIPGNEKMVTKVINGLLRLGADVIYENMYDVHASGHACQEEQKLIMNLTRPRFFIPVHGEYKHLKRHAMTAEAVGIPRANILIADTGDAITLSRDGIKVEDTVQAGAVMVDGLGVGDVGSAVLRDRRLLSEDGIVVLAASVEARTGKLVSGPDIHTRGFVYVRDSEQLLEDTRLAILKVLQAYPKEGHRDAGSLKTRIRETASSFLYRKTKRSPMILPVIMEV